ncbi:MAG TPA: hypothetical protein VN914_10110, partial [Polyangia bacterium]|nr:hypothetical protein [Polyangia bacterium]
MVVGKPTETRASGGEAPRSFEYDAFISYRRLDGTLTARWLRHRLQAFKLPTGVEGHGHRPLRCYLDT